MVRRFLDSSLFAGLVIAGVIGESCFLAWQVLVPLSQGVTVTPAICRISNLHVDETRLLALTIENDSAKDVEFLGANSRCGDHYCLGVVPPPSVIDPGKSADIECHVKVRSPGAFCESLTFFFKVNDRLVEKKVQFTASVTGRPVAENSDADRQSD